MNKVKIGTSRILLALEIVSVILAAALIASIGLYYNEIRQKDSQIGCSPRALNASSGPYEEDERPSAPRPIHARMGMRDNL
jgi:hypothetical protein